MTEALARGDADVLDEPLAPGCDNRMTGGVDCGGFKAMSSRRIRCRSLPP